MKITEGNITIILVKMEQALLQILSVMITIEGLDLFKTYYAYFV